MENNEAQLMQTACRVTKFCTAVSIVAAFDPSWSSDVFVFRQIDTAMFVSIMGARSPL
jgi:hypothetical protein